MLEGHADGDGAAADDVDDCMQLSKELSWNPRAKEKICRPVNIFASDSQQSDDDEDGDDNFHHHHHSYHHHHHH